MVFVFLNFLLGIFLFLFASSIEIHFSDSKSRKLSSLFLYAVAVAVCTGALYASSQNTQLYGLLYTLLLFVSAFFVIKMCGYAIAFPYFKKSVVPIILQVILVVLDFFLVSQKNAAFFGISSLVLYEWIFLIALPVVSVIVCLTRILSMHSVIYKQQIWVNIGGLLLNLGFMFLIKGISNLHPIYSSLLPFGIALTLILFYRATLLSTLYDIRFFITFFAGALFQFGIVGFVAGLVFAVSHYFLQPISTGIFMLVTCTVFIILLLIRPRLTAIGKKLIRFGSEYAGVLEDDFKRIDYNEPLNLVTDQFCTIIDKNIGSSSVRIFVEEKDGVLLSLQDADNKKMEIKTAHAALELLVNLNQSIVFKTQVVTKFEYTEVKQDFLELFESCNAEALIVLREDRHIFALIMLGAKKLGGQYTEYDYMTFSKLLSHFFVFAYYLKNIAHEALVGTVNREIDYSEQIIHSIQQNMDFIENPKVQVDYISFAARKLGGNFIDFIRLTNNKYIFVMGDVSGKGLNASLSMVILKSVVRTFLTEIKDFKQLVVKVNEFIKCNLPQGTFFAGVFALFDFSVNTMYYINCGIPAMFLYTESYNTAIEIQGSGKMLGFVKDVSTLLKVKKTQFNVNDILLITTSGIINAESLRGEIFGKDRIQKFILENKEYPASRMVQFLQEQVTNFTAKKLEDDVTILGLKYLVK